MTVCTKFYDQFLYRTYCKFLIIPVSSLVSHTNWTSLYNLQTRDMMVNTFYSTKDDLIDYYLPLLTVTRHTTDKL